MFIFASLATEALLGKLTCATGLHLPFNTILFPSKEYFNKDLQVLNVSLSPYLKIYLWAPLPILDKIDSKKLTDKTSKKACMREGIQWYLVGVSEYKE